VGSVGADFLDLVVRSGKFSRFSAVGAEKLENSEQNLDVDGVRRGFRGFAR
jgi:hypothetical protein